MAVACVNDCAKCVTIFKRAQIPLCLISAAGRMRLMNMITGGVLNAEKLSKEQSPCLLERVTHCSSVRELEEDYYSVVVLSLEYYFSSM